MAVTVCQGLIKIGLPVDGSWRRLTAGRAQDLTPLHGSLASCPVGLYTAEPGRSPDHGLASLSGCGAGGLGIATTALLPALPAGGNRGQGWGAGGGGRLGQGEPGTKVHRCNDDILFSLTELFRALSCYGSRSELSPPYHTTPTTPHLPPHHTTLLNTHTPTPLHTPQLTTLHTLNSPHRTPSTPHHTMLQHQQPNHTITLPHNHTIIPQQPHHHTHTNSQHLYPPKT